MFSLVTINIIIITIIFIIISMVVLEISTREILRLDLFKCGHSERENLDALLQFLSHLDRTMHVCEVPVHAKLLRGAQAGDGLGNGWVHIGLARAHTAVVYERVLEAVNEANEFRAVDRNQLSWLLYEVVELLLKDVPVLQLRELQDKLRLQPLPAQFHPCLYCSNHVLLLQPRGDQPRPPCIGHLVHLVELLDVLQEPV